MAYLVDVRVRGVHVLEVLAIGPLLFYGLPSVRARGVCALEVLAKGAPFILWLIYLMYPIHNFCLIEFFRYNYLR